MSERENNFYSLLNPIERAHDELFDALRNKYQEPQTEPEEDAKQDAFLYALLERDLLELDSLDTNIYLKELENWNQVIKEAREENWLPLQQKIREQARETKIADAALTTTRKQEIVALTNLARSLEV